MHEYILEMRGITKGFSGVRALDNVHLSVRQGEIHALCGENGAGKSTLMKVLSGVWQYGTYSGDIVINGKTMKFESTRDSEEVGIAVIYQELALVKEMDVAENIYLGKWFNRRGVVQFDKIYREATKLMKSLGLDIDLSAKIRDIGIGHQQLVEIAKALTTNAKILILDEPTAALTESEVKLLIDNIRKLKQQGVTCILISHKLNEVFEIADRITILRDGATIGTYNTSELTEEIVIAKMVGRELTQRYPPKIPHEFGSVILEVRDYNVVDARDGKPILQDVNFSVRKGEILGISGLMGAGRTELLTSIYGFFVGHRKGQILVDGEVVDIRSPINALAHGIGMVFEDRKRYGLVLSQSVKENITLSSLRRMGRFGCINSDREVFESKEYVNRMGVKTQSVEAIVNTLSGGNQQKVVLARGLMTKPKIIFLDEPTRGIDVGAKFEIYSHMNHLAADGVAIVMISSELPEIIGMSDRVIVMHNGRISGEFINKEVTQEKVMHCASGRFAV
jgi:D-xylose transport system ATP-binding protein